MKALLLAAGLGTRMRPLTLNTPKPLLPLAGKPIIVHHIDKLVAAGIRELLINVCYLGEQIEQALGDGAALGASIRYSREPGGPYDTGGAIRHARVLLGEEPFLLVAGDTWTDYPYQQLAGRELGADELGHLVLVANPPHHESGDFALAADGRLNREGRGIALTYSGLALLRPSIVTGWEQTVFPLREPLRAAAANGRLGGECWNGAWEDVGTPERYSELDRRLSR